MPGWDLQVSSHGAVADVVGTVQLHRLSFFPSLSLLLTALCTRVTLTDVNMNGQR